MSATIDTAPVEEKVRTTRTANPELQVMAKIDRLLSEELPDEAARGRVVAWLTSYYGPTPAECVGQAG